MIWHLVLIGKGVVMNSNEMASGNSIVHRAAWRGAELADSDFWEMKLPEHWMDPADSLSEAKWYADIQRELENGKGGVLIKASEMLQAYSTNQLTDIFRRFCAQIGTPISQSAKGETVFSVRDEGFGKDDARTRGPNTRNKLSFHTDRCDVIAFLCLQTAKSGGENQVVSSMTLYNEMLKRRPDLAETLEQPFYYQRHNVDLGNSSPYTQQPIFSFYEGAFASNFLRVLIERAYASGEVPEMTDKQKEAMDFLEELADDTDLHFTFRQEQGDILLLNNWVTYHRRTAFEDFDDLDRRRHLLRVWLSMPNSRAIDPLFAGNYGETAAGAIRGGMKARTG